MARRITPEPMRITMQEYNIVEQATEILCRLCDDKDCRECKLRRLSEEAHVAMMRNEE